MVVNDKLKQIIFKQLYKEMGDCEIIPYKDSIWFINRENEYWYFELDKSGALWWRYHFFTSFFNIFSMTANDFTPILSSWVEEVLNHKVETTSQPVSRNLIRVEEVLNHKVSTNGIAEIAPKILVEEVLNHKVSTTKNSNRLNLIRVENALKYKVSTTPRHSLPYSTKVDEVLNHKVSETQTGNAPPLSLVKDVLNHN